MDGDEVGARLGELFDLRFEDGIRHHEVNVERFARLVAHRGDKIGKKQHGRREMAVRDINMEYVRRGFDTRHVAREIDEIGGPERYFRDQALRRKIVEPAGLRSHSSISDRNAATAARTSLR